MGEEIKRRRSKIYQDSRRGGGSGNGLLEEGDYEGASFGLEEDET